MNTERAVIKARLAMDRGVPRPPQRTVGGQPFYYVTVCDLCGALEPSDLHENIVTRADVMKNKPLQELILTGEENLHLLCPRCNVDLALREPFHEWLISINLYRYGLERTVEWLEGLPFKTGPGQYLRQVRYVARDMLTTDYSYRWGLVNAALRERGVTATLPYTYEEVKQWQSKSSPVRP